MDSDAAPAGGGAPPAFDLNAFFTRFDQMLDKKLGALKPADPPPPPAPPEPPPPTPPVDAPKPPAAPLPDPRLAKLENDLAEERKSRKETERKSEEKDRHSQVRSMMSEFIYASERSREDAFRSFAAEITRGTDDALVGPTGEAASEYVRKLLEGERNYYLKPREIGGAGAHNPGGRQSKPLDLNDIKPGMKPEDLTRARAEISRIAHNALLGQ